LALLEVFTSYESDDLVVLVDVKVAAVSVFSGVLKALQKNNYILVIHQHIVAFRFGESSQSSSYSWVCVSSLDVMKYVGRGTLVMQITQLLLVIGPTI